MKGLSVVGQPGIKRVDATGKATGEAIFADDISGRPALVGRILRSTQHHARILNIDASKARRLPGVKAVVTAAEWPGIKIGPYTQDEEVLAVSKVRFVGDHVAAVAAVDEDTAEEALNLIKVEYAPLPAVFDASEAMRPDASRVHDNSTNIGRHIAYTRGDIDAAFSKADLIFEETFRTHRVSPASLEPACCVVDFQSSGHLQVWAGLSDIFSLRRLLAAYLKAPENNIHVFQPVLGGCFGGKGSVTRGSMCCIAALLSRTAGKPVKIVNSWQDEMFAGRFRLAMDIRMKFGVKADGTVIAKETTTIANAGAYQGVGDLIYATATKRHESLYRFKNIRNEAFLVYTNTVPGSPYRGFGNPQGHFAVESMMDIAAEKLGLDPAEIRLRNATHAGDVTAHGWKIESCGLTECIEAAVKKSEWKQRRGEGKTGAGLGIGCMIHVAGRRSRKEFYGSRALVKVERDGRATVFSGEGDQGEGLDTALAIIAAEELGIPLKNVNVARPDTDTSPIVMGLFSDRGTVLAGNAVRLAARDARGQLLEMAAKMREVSAEELTIREGRVYAKGNPDFSLSVAEVASFALSRHDAQTLILGQGAWDPPSVMPDPVTGYGNISTSYTFAGQVAEVQVDRETGMFKVARVSAAHDLGTAINPMAARGQIEGAIVQGMGYATMETLGEHGGPPMSNFLDYLMPSSLDIPALETMLVETEDPHGPFGAKGVGEPGMVAIAAAIGNAIYDAVGVRVRDLPITPDKVLGGLRREKRVT